MQKEDEKMRYRIEEADGSERFLSISGENNVIHIYRFFNKQLIFVATVWPCDSGFNPIKFHDEAPINRVKDIKDALRILRKYKQGTVKLISKKSAHMLLCP